MGQAVVHFEIVGKDIEKLKSFYSELAGWNYGEPPGATQEGVPPYALISRDENPGSDGNPTLNGGIGQGPGDDYPGHVTFYIEVESVGDSLDKAESLGGTRVMGPESPVEGLVIGLFNDPEGHLIGLVEPPQAG